MEQEPAGGRSRLGPRRQMVRAAVGFTLYLFLVPGLLFLGAGTLAWPMAWVYFALSLVAALGSRLIALRRSPGLLRERAQLTEGEGAKPWDRLLVAVVGLYGPLVIALVAGVNHRYAWGPAVPAGIQALAAVLLAASYALASWAMIVNRFFSAVVRIQRERGHVVVSSGPYGVVRHPAYAGGILAYLSLPFMLDAIWALLPSLAIALVVILRTSLEDRALVAELPGYRDYAAHTRWRLLPGVW